MVAAIAWLPEVNRAELVQFDATTNFPASNYPGVMVAADFNSDGNSDIAVTTSGGLSLLLGNGGGALGTPTQYPSTMFGSGALATGDFNGDGKVDLIIRGDTVVRVMSGHGDGSFTMGRPLPPVTAGVNSPGTLAAGDFDGNGTPDLAFASYSSDSVAVSLNQTPPVLEITPRAGYNQIAWLATFGTGFTLECTTNLLIHVAGLFPGYQRQAGRLSYLRDFRAGSIASLAELNRMAVAIASRPCFAPAATRHWRDEPGRR